MQGVAGTIGLGLIELEVFLLADGMEGAVTQTEQFVSIPKARIKKSKSNMPRFVEDLQKHMVQGNVLTWNLNSGDKLSDNVPSVAVLVRFKDASRIDECLFASRNDEYAASRLAVFECSKCGDTYRLKLTAGNPCRQYFCEPCDTGSRRKNLMML